MNTKLNNAKAKKDDEFYTLREDVERIFKELTEQKIITDEVLIQLPFDGEKSEFYKYIKNKYAGLIDFKFDYKNFPYQKNGIVVSNPPFSILREILLFYVNKNIKFFLVAPLTSMATEVCIKLFNDRLINYSYLPITKFKKPSGDYANVMCIIITNIKEYKPKFWTPAGGFKEPEEFNKYDELMKNEQLQLFEKLEKKSIERAGLKPGLKHVYYTIHYNMTEYAYLNRNIIIKEYIRDKTKRRSFKRLIFMENK